MLLNLSLIAKMHLVNLTILFTLNKNIPIIRRERFSGEIVKIDNCSLTLFSSGKVIATGKHISEEKRKIVEQVLKDRNFEVKIVSTKIINMVFSGQVSLATSWFEATRLPCFTYEPELFPSCVWRAGTACAAALWSTALSC